MTFETFLAVLAVAFALIVVGIIILGVLHHHESAYKRGYAAGHDAAMLRVHEVEARMERDLIRRAIERQDEFEEELDV